MAWGKSALFTHFSPGVLIMTDINEKIKEQEQLRVKDVIQVINKKMHILEEKTGGLKQDIVFLRKTFWEDVTVNLDEPDDVIETHASLRQQAEFLSERERSRGLIYKQLKNLERLKSSPYFGRIDFVEAGMDSPEQIYIGLFSLMDEQDEHFLVYDWRAPISSMYYDFTPGPAYYETMDETITGEMVLKRQYIIRQGIIKGMFDTGITIGDEILQAVLSNQANSQMKSIVATIQKEQNEIIRNDQKKYLVVQGPAGSGKTSAALQRIAYLLYKYRERLRADNILLFSPNQLFNRYVSTVLPELGEDNMEQSTLYQFLQHHLKEFEIEDPYGQLEYMLSGKRDKWYRIRKAAIQFKASMMFKQLIDQYVSSLNRDGMLFKHIMFQKEQLISKASLKNYFYSLDQRLSIPNRIQFVKEWILSKIDETEQEEKTKEWVTKESELLDREEYVKVFRKLQKEQRFTENTFNDFEREEKMLASLIIKRKLRPLRKKVNELAFVDISGLYNQLYTWASEANHGVELPEEWKEMGEIVKSRLRRRKIYYEDATPYLYLKECLVGKHIYKKIRHLFIDEAQDYSPFQLAYFQEVFPHSNMTILGDVNQSIFTHSSGAQNELFQSEQLFPNEELETIILTKSYRSTKQIFEFTEGILKDNHKVVPFNRNGELPQVIFVKNEQILHQTLIDIIDHLQGKAFETIAIICKTVQETKQAYERLKDMLNIQMIQKETQSYDKGLLLIPSYLAKGIEFDSVIIYNASNEVYKEEDERRLFYTACTRAMHELYLFSIGKESVFLQNVDQNKYKRIQI